MSDIVFGVICGILLTIAAFLAGESLYEHGRESLAKSVVASCETVNVLSYKGKVYDCKVRP